MFKGFRSFLLRGNVVDLAVGIVIGAAFTAVVTGFVTAFLTPLVGVATGAVGDFTEKTFEVAGARFPYGVFVNALIGFVLVAAVIYFVVVVPVGKLQAKLAGAEPEPVAKEDCPECLSRIPVAAVRCSFCTTEVAGRPGFPAQRGPVEPPAAKTGGKTTGKTAAKAAERGAEQGGEQAAEQSAEQAAPAR
ncbi:large conductance mechanosensitive channel protein MscL [Kitasatospora sp. NPDC058115]|uniref:large conductance mechanosensitive channel protein MscL n=1 Tax=Kitasatospora sp. NPDC058115 TaxID=3346347 RepID=UPI0036D9F199